MRLYPRSRAAALCAVAATALAASTATAAPHRMDPQQPISGFSPFTATCSKARPQHYNSETEPSIVVSPRDSDVVVATWMQDASVGHPVARSLDGGETWLKDVPQGITPCTNGDRADSVFNPSLSFGVDGQLYLSSSSAAQSHPLTGPTGTYNPLSQPIWMHVSVDNGWTWRDPVVAGGESNDGFTIDAPSITGDPFRSGMAYLTWSRTSPAGVAGLGFSVTTDGGYTWNPSALPITFPGARGVVSGSKVVVDPRSGDLLIITGEALAQPGGAAGQTFGTTRFFVLRSSDLGSTWSAPVQIGDAAQFPAVPSVTVSQVGRIYVTWSSGSTSGSSVYVVSSVDGGSTWSRPAPVATSRNARLPSIAVDGRGVVGLTWYEDHGGLVSAMSFDHGRTWVQRPLTSRLDLSRVPATNAAGGAPLGDHAGLAPLRVGFVSIASLPAPYTYFGPTDIWVTRFGE
jgi:hypothetical protein